MKQNKIIALTGGIGSGKSTVLQIVNNLGYKTLSCDAITQDLYKKRRIKKALKRLFPSAVSGFLCLKVDKRVISQEVFANQEKLSKLNTLFHKEIMQEVFIRAKKESASVFVEVPLLFENGFEKQFDAVWVVKRDIEKRLSSVMERSGLSQEEFFARVNTQTNYENLDLSPYTVIYNDGDIEQLQEKIINLLKTL